MSMAVSVLHVQNTLVLLYCLFSVRNDHFFVVVLPVIIFRWTSVLLVRASILPVRVQFVCCMYNTGIILMDIWSACLNKRFHPRA
jgi:hypothetical protein